ncbi:MAG TPA: transglycosylase domain-containing protein [Acidimicrobiales bacterium]|nr:transglycosylase domain-containing protein [Acidimicrobiales bacterium]
MGTAAHARVPDARRRRLPRPHIPDRVRYLPWRFIVPAAFAVLAIIAAVPPLREATANAATRTILFAARPFAPNVAGFDRLPQTTKVLAADGTVLATLDDGQKREPLQLKALPDHVPHAVLAAEDEHFYEHGGIDLTAVVRATIRNVQGDRQGGSTITQQLAKLNYTGSQRTFLRKFREVLYADQLERKYSKDELLQRYLNQVYLGDGAYGFAAAADSYFGVPPDKLSAAQAATLAGMIRSPERLDPRTHPAAVTARRNDVLKNMVRNRWLTKSAGAAAMAEPLTVVPPHGGQNAMKAPHFVRYVQREAMTLDALGGSTESRGKELFTGGYTIKTTLDPKAFDAAAAAAQAQLGAPNDPTEAVVSVIPGDGGIRNLFAGLDPNRKFDVATQGRRQPGSAFKPFVYLAAIEAGIDPRSTLDGSSPRTFDYKGSSFTVSNYDEGHGGGQMSIDDALVESVNTVYMDLALHVGPENVVRTAEKAGIPSGIRPLPAVALGGVSKGVSPLEMAAAYATFAAKGVYATPYAIASITDRDGRTIYTHTPQTRQAFDEREVGNLNRPLQDVVRRGTGQAAAIGRPLAGKTGTTQNWTNGWFVGYTPQLATAVWVGHPDGDVPMTSVHGRHVTGGSFPAQIFSATMRVALQGVKATPIPTADPESLSLQPLTPPPPPSVPTSLAPTTTVPPDATTTTSSVPEPTTTTVPPSPTTTVAPAPTTTAPSGPPNRSGT